MVEVWWDFFFFSSNFEQGWEPTLHSITVSYPHHPQQPAPRMNNFCMRDSRNNRWMNHRRVNVICHCTGSGRPRVMDETQGQNLWQGNAARAGWKGRRDGWRGKGVCVNDMVICTQRSSDVIKAMIWWVVSVPRLMTNAMRWNWKRHWCQAEVE